ncbi:MAG: NINE protein [Pirellulaceae bacterium]|jgi:TM2 domain-containing membrane protein YozV|nr:NINE protein [Pirellulaceae bacterium]MDP7020495.1 NINE protein [Pirellulaceae bacterium]
MAIELACSQCASALRVGDDSRGKRVRCPKCEEIMYVPASETAESWRLRGEDGDEYGPISRPQLEQWVQEGRVSAKCQVIRDGDNQWQWAVNVFPHLGSTAGRGNANGRAVGATAVAGGTAYSQHRATSFAPAGKSKIAAGMLALMGLPLGIHGIHRFYLGYPGTGILMLLTFGGCGIWTIIDAILVFAGSMPDGDGRPLTD